MNFKALTTAAALIAGVVLPAPLPLSATVLGGVRSERELPPAACSVVYLSDATATNDQLYKTVGVVWPAYVPHPTLPAVDNGWGIWASPALIFAGAAGAPDKINVYKPCALGLARSYTTNSLGPPESIATEGNNGPVYATEMGSTTVDCGVALVLPACTDTNPTFTGTPAYVALDNINQVYLSGEDVNTNQQVDQCNAAITICTTCETIVGPSVPGGLAVDGNQHLIVNDELNATLYSYATGAGTCGLAPLSTYKYGFPLLSDHFTFTAITLSTSEAFIVGAKEWTTFGGFCPAISFPCMNAKEVNYNPITAIIGPMAPDHSVILANQVPGTGIAITPPGPF